MPEKKENIVCAFHEDMENADSCVFKKIDGLSSRIEKMVITVIVLAVLSGVNVAINVIEFF